MARRKGRKEWNGISRGEWLDILADPEITTDLMMRILSVLARLPGHADRAKHIASVLGVEYRALNAAVGWAGTKVRAWCEAHKGTEACAGPSAPWEYVFDGAEEEDGTYLWILKPAAAEALAEMDRADWPERRAVEAILADDASSFGREGSLFAKAPPTTVDRIRQSLDEERAFFRRALTGGARCTVCGLTRLSLLRAVPYGEGGRKNRGLLFCPTHAALFAARLISFGPKGELLIADALSDEDRAALGLAEGMRARNPFSGRRMTVHRRQFKGGRKNP